MSGALQYGRGGLHALSLGEWGGEDHEVEQVVGHVVEGDMKPKGASPPKAFLEQRPGYAAPIHELLRREAANGSSVVVFKGHDHLYAYEQQDGVRYVTVPRSHCNANPTMPKQSTRYYDGVVKLNDPGEPFGGWVRVSVGGGTAEVELVSNCRSGGGGGRSGPPNKGVRPGDVMHAFTASLQEAGRPQTARRESHGRSKAGGA